MPINRIIHEANIANIINQMLDGTNDDKRENEQKLPY